MILGVCAIIGGLILAILVRGSTPQSEPTPALVWVFVGVAASGLVMMGVGAVYHVKARGRHWAWVFLTFLDIPGIIILSRLRDRKDIEREREQNRLPGPDDEIFEIDDESPEG
jgi:hypothetical protein